MSFIVASLVTEHTAIALTAHPDYIDTYVKFPSIESGGAININRGHTIKML
jgi:hypothetical protein